VKYSIPEWLYNTFLEFSHFSDDVVKKLFSFLESELCKIATTYFEDLHERFMQFVLGIICRRYKHQDNFFTLTDIILEKEVKKMDNLNYFVDTKLPLENPTKTGSGFVDVSFKVNKSQVYVELKNVPLRDILLDGKSLAEKMEIVHQRGPSELRLSEKNPWRQRLNVETVQQLIEVSVHQNRQYYEVTTQSFHS